MAKKDNHKVLAKEVLAEVLRDPYMLKIFSEILEDFGIEEGGEPVLVYGGASKEAGDFRCEFRPLAAVEQIVVECAATYDKLSAASGAEERKFLSENREWMVRQVAHHATLTLLANPLNKLASAFWQNFQESKLTAHLTLASLLGELAGFSEIEDQFNVRVEIKALADEVRAEEISHLRELVERHIHVVAEGRRGRPRAVKTEAVRDMLREHGRVTAERAAELLGCGLQTLKDWAAATEWKTWARARTAILAQLKTDGK